MKNIGLRIHDADFEAGRRATAEAATLGDLISAFRRQYILVLVFAALGLLFGLAHHITTPKQYYTSATILVDERRSELDEQIIASIPFARNDTSLLNEMQVLKSLQLASDVVDRIDLHENEIFLYPPSSLARSVLSDAKSMAAGMLGAEEDAAAPTAADPDAQLQRRKLQTAARLQRDIRVERIGLSFSIEISYIGHDPDLAAMIVNSYADAYLDDRMNANADATERTAAWMRSRLDALEQDAANVLAEAAALRQSDPTQITRLRELAQRASTLDELHQTISARYEQISVQGSFPVSNGRVLTRSMMPKEPALPKMWRTVSVTIMLGLMFGFLLAVLREARERFFRVSTDVHDHTGLPFLGHLPRIDDAEMTGRATPSAPTKPAEPVAKGKPPFALPPHMAFSVARPHTMFSQTIRNIHASIAFGAPEGGKIVAVTSMLPEEGKTTLAVNYANLVAQSGARCLLIDMDLQGAGFDWAPAGPGIIDVLSGDIPLSESIHRLDHTGLNILPSGSAADQPRSGEIGIQRKLKALMPELRKHYDHIVLDMPPLSNGPDAKAMIGMLDKIVLVCEWGATPRSLVTRYLAHEPEVFQKVAGIALNKVDVRKLRRYARPGWPESYLTLTPRMA